MTRIAARVFAAAAFAARASAAALVLLAATAAPVVGIGPVGANAAEPACATPPPLLSLEPTLNYVAAKLAKRGKLTILAMGSSSTEGVGASSPDTTYPSRLEAELRRRFPDINIRVINRGKGGEDAPDELVRLERDVIADDPDLVIWQVGTNAALRRLDPAIERDVLRRGIAVIKDSAADVVLMDLQYAPDVLASPAAATMEKLIAEVAERSRVGLFRRFEIMRHWLSDAPSAVGSSAAGSSAAGSSAAGSSAAWPAISPDGLHMTDRSYACLAASLADAIARNWRQYQAARASTGAVARLHGAPDSGPRGNGAPRLQPPT
jgi:acyl-CoA thioesterase-1